MKGVRTLDVVQYNEDLIATFKQHLSIESEPSPFYEDPDVYDHFDDYKDIDVFYDNNDVDGN